MASIGDQTVMHADAEPMPRSHPLRRLIVLVLALSLVACSRVSLVYDNADWLVYRWAVGLVGATEAQREQWRTWFDDLIAEHRDQLLPEITALLREIELSAERGMNARTANCLLDRADELYRAHARLAIPLAVDILTVLSPDQQRYLGEQMAERNAEFVADYLPEDPDVRREARVERYLDRIERWTGRLDQAQRERVAAAIAAMPNPAEGWLAYRRHQQQRLLALLHEGVTREQLTGFLTAWWVDFADRPPHLVAAIDEVRRRSVALTLDVDASLTPPQRGHFVDEVSELRVGLSDAIQGAAQPAVLVPRCS